MSGLAAIIGFGGASADTGLVHKMIAAMDYRARAGVTIRTGTSPAHAAAAIAHCRMHAPGRDEATAGQPLVHEPSGVIVALDGFLANHAELRRDLAARGAVLASAEDAELVLHAFLVWGPECAVRLEGEFAALVWDPRTGDLHAVRDHHGLRPLYYWHSGDTVVVASEIAAVLAGLPHQPPLNRPYLAEVALDLSFTHDETVWQGIRRVPQAHVLRAHPGGLSLREYWRLPTEVTLPIRSDDEYIEAYRSELTESVRRAARSPAPIACEVSGGLDSSGVFAMAHNLSGRGELPAPGLEGFTLAGPPGSPADEVDYARAVGRHTGRTVHESPLFMPPLCWFAERARIDRDAPPWPNAAMSLALDQAATAAGCRVLLGGIGGDQWLDGSAFYYYELLAAGDWRRLAAQFAADMRDRGPGKAIPLALRRGPATLLPEWVRSLGRGGAQPARSPAHAAATAAGLLPDLCAALAEREARYEARFPARYHAAYKVRKLHHPRWTRVLDQAVRQRARSGLEMRNPMMARSFITFSAATPEHMRLRGSTGKYLHRRALAGLLPEAVLNRRSKAEFSAPYFRHDADLHEFCSRTAIAELETLYSPGAVGDLFARYLATPIDERYTGEVWGTYSSGLLLQRGTDLGVKGNQ